MSAPEQQDGEDEAQADEEAAAAHVGADRLRIAQLLPRDHDPLGPLRGQLADIGRIVNQPLMDTMASIRAQQNARITAAVNAVVKPTLNIIDPALIAPIVRPLAPSDGLREAIAAVTAGQNAMVRDVLRIAGAADQVRVGFLSNSVRLFENNFGASGLGTQLELLGPALTASPTAQPAVSRGLREAIAAVTAGQNAMVKDALWIAGAADQVRASILNNSVRLVQNDFATSYASSLSRIAEEISLAFTKDLFAGFASFRELFKDWLPDNLTGLDAKRWMWLLRVAAKDGTCLAWAPRAEIVDALLALPSTASRRQYLADHRLELVEDVEASLEEVDHPCEWVGWCQRVGWQQVG